MMVGRGGNRPMADINVTPFVDVVLVLLIIFMVTAPFLSGGLEIDLPKVATKGLDVHEGLIVSIRRDLTIASPWVLSLNGSAVHRQSEAKGGQNEGGALAEHGRESPRSASRTSSGIRVTRGKPPRRSRCKKLEKHPDRPCYVLGR